MYLSLASSLLGSTLVTTAIAGPLNSRQAAGSISCDFGGPNNIATADINNAINILNSGGSISGLDSGNPIFLGDVFEGFGTQTGTVGSFQFELDNGNALKATHVSFGTVAGALQTYVEQCCGVFDQCIGGSTKVSGDTGLKVNLQMRAA